MTVRRAWAAAAAVLLAAAAMLLSGGRRAESSQADPTCRNPGSNAPACRPTPSPSPTQTTPPPSEPPPVCASGSLDRSCYPDASNTGVPAGTVLSPYCLSGYVVLDVDGMAYDSRFFGCDVIVRGTITITRSEITGFVDVQSGGLVLADSLVSPGVGVYELLDRPPVRGPGAYTLRRVHVRGWQDGPRTDSGPKLIEDSLLDDLGFWVGEHPDGLQQYAPGADSDVVVRHSTVSGCAGNSPDRGSAALFWSDFPGPGSTLTITDSWFACGQYAIRVNDATAGSGVTVSVTGAVVEAGSYVYGPAECRNSAASSFGDRWDVRLSTGEPVSLASCLGA